MLWWHVTYANRVDFGLRLNLSDETLSTNQQNVVRKTIAASEDAQSDPDIEAFELSRKCITTYPRYRHIGAKGKPLSAWDDEESECE